MAQTERVLVLIDGGNTYSALFRNKKDLQGNITTKALLSKGVIFDYRKFIDYLVQGREFIGIRYYIGIVRNTDGTEKSQAMQKFLQKLENAGILIERGRIVYDHGTREKGVDVKIAIDIVIEALENTYDTVILLVRTLILFLRLNMFARKAKRLSMLVFVNSVDVDPLFR